MNLPFPTGDPIITSPTLYNVANGIIGFVSRQSKGKKKISKSTQTLAIQDSSSKNLSLKSISKINGLESSIGEN